MLLKNAFSKKIRHISAFLAVTLIAGSAQANYRALPLPTGEPSADEVAKQVYYTNHFYAFRNFSIPRKGSRMAVLILKDSQGRVTRTAVERFLNNDYSLTDPVSSRDLAIFRSGRLRGTGLLVTDYAQEGKSQSYSIWLPALRKVRRFAEPAHDDAWGGSVFTFGDVSLREPEDETHELIGKKTFRSCLGAIDDLVGRNYRYAGKLPRKVCRHVGKQVYGLKSTPKRKNWWYDHRISFVDTKSYADYRTVFFKNGRMIKIIDRDWGIVSHSGKKDPRALFWKHWYGVDLETGSESWAVVPQNIIEFDTSRPSSFWSESKLRRIRR